MLQSLKTLLIAVVLFFGVAVVSAQVSVWNPPSQNPPNGNTPAPLNVGTLDQVKSAGLSLNRLLVNGQVQINDGTAAVGKVLTSLDAQGTAQWAVAGAVGASADLEYKTDTWTAWQFVLPQTITKGAAIKYTNSPYREPTATCSAGKKVIGGGCHMVLRYKTASVTTSQFDGAQLNSGNIDIWGKMINPYNTNFLTNTSCPNYFNGVLFSLYRSGPNDSGTGWVCGVGPESANTCSTGVPNTLYSLKATAICQ